MFVKDCCSCGLRTECNEKGWEEEDHSGSWCHNPDKRLIVAKTRLALAEAVRNVLIVF